MKSKPFKKLNSIILIIFIFQLNIVYANNVKGEIENINNINQNSTLIIISFLAIYFASKIVKILKRFHNADKGSQSFVVMTTIISVILFFLSIIIWFINEFNTLIMLGSQLVFGLIIGYLQIRQNDQVFQFQRQQISINEVNEKYYRALTFLNMNPNVQIEGIDILTDLGTSKNTNIELREKIWQHLNLLITDNTQKPQHVTNKLFQAIDRMRNENGSHD